MTNKELRALAEARASAPSDYDMHPELTEALAELLWDYLVKDKEHKDQRWTGHGTKTKLGLRKSIEGIIDFWWS